MYNDLKETMDNELKEIRKMMYEKNENINKDRNFKKKPKKFSN